MIEHLWWAASETCPSQHVFTSGDLWAATWLRNELQVLCLNCIRGTRMPFCPWPQITGEEWQFFLETEWKIDPSVTNPVWNDGLWLWHCYADAKINPTQNGPCIENISNMFWERLTDNFLNFNLSSEPCTCPFSLCQHLTLLKEYSVNLFLWNSIRRTKMAA